MTQRKIRKTKLLTIICNVILRHINKIFDRALFYNGFIGFLIIRKFYRELWCKTRDLGNGGLFIDYLNKSKLLVHCGVPVTPGSKSEIGINDYLYAPLDLLVCCIPQIKSSNQRFFR